MSLKPVNDEFDRAYANVGLLASDVWCYQNEESDYKKANLNLWIRFNETEKRLIEDDNSDDLLSTSSEAIYTVKDILPFSRLATYGNFEYNELREEMYVDDDGVPSPKYTKNSYHLSHEDLEVWMLPEVEKEFKRYSRSCQSGWCMLSPRYPSGRELVPIGQITNANPQQWLSETQWQNRLLSHYAEKLPYLKLSTEISIFRDDLEPPVYDAEEVESKLLDYPFPRYLINHSADQRLHEVINSAAIRSLWANHNYPYGSFSQSFDLNAEVPEFQPVTFSSKFKVEGETSHPIVTNQNSVNLHQIVHGFSANESFCGARQQYYVSIFDMNYEAEVFPYSNINKYASEPQTWFFEFNGDDQLNPSTVNPSGLHFNMEMLKSTWNKQQEDCTTNVATLSSEPGVQPYKNQNAEKMLAWVTKIYNPRSTDFHEMNSISNKISVIFEDVQHGYCLVQRPELIIQQPDAAPHLSLCNNDLMGEVNPAVTNSESQFDKLEQEALEQYSGSGTVIPTFPPESQQIPGEVKANEESFPRLEPQVKKDVIHYRPPSPPPGKDVSSLEEPPTCLSDRPSEVSVLEEKICNEVETKLEPFPTNMQAKWMKKRNKKSEKKKKNTKYNKKKLLSVELNTKLIESEIILINKFLELSNTFNKTFFQGCWKLVQDQLTESIESTFERCLVTFEDCMEWFVFLTQNTSQGFSNPKKRIDLLGKVVNLAENLIITLQQYVNLFNEIKMTIPCDHRLYFETERFVKQRPILKPQMDSGSKDQIVLSAAIPNIKCSLGFLNSVIQKDKLGLTCRHEWNLHQNFDVPMNRRTLQIQISILKDSQIRLSICETEKEEPNVTANKLVKIIEDYPTWNGHQWKFVDGWKLDMSESLFSLQWFNRFNVKILEQTATSASLFFVLKWFDDLTKAAVSKKCYPSCEVLWNRNTPNLVSSKMVFLKLLLQNDRDWYFGDVRINHTGCCRLSFGCENPCCVSWMLSYSKRAKIGQSVSTDERRVTSRPAKTRCRKEETSRKKNSSKSKRSDSFSNEIIFTDSPEDFSKINLPQEKSSCVIQ